MSLAAKRIAFEAIWPSLQNEIETLFQQKELQKLSAMEMYQNVYDLCIIYTTMARA
jgi:hypothetical protein